MKKQYVWESWMAKQFQTRKANVRKAFTLLEVLISIALLGIMLPALFSAVDMLKDSNDHLLTHLEKSKKVTKATKVLYMDILSSDGNITIKTEEQSRLCMNESKNSLYGLPVAKVCWVVMKEKNTLARIEGGYFSLPLKSEDRVEVDLVMQGVEKFDVYHQKDKILVLLKEKNKNPISFLVQGVSKPVKKKVKKKKTKPKSQQRRKPSNRKPGRQKPVKPPAANPNLDV